MLLNPLDLVTIQTWKIYLVVLVSMVMRIFLAQGAILVADLVLLIAVLVLVALVALTVVIVILALVLVVVVALVAVDRGPADAPTTAGGGKGE